MIVKVQRSITTSFGEAQMLIYDQFREYEYQGPMTDQVAKVFRDGEWKAFVYAELSGDELVLKEGAPWQNW